MNHNGFSPKAYFSQAMHAGACVLLALAVFLLFLNSGLDRFAMAAAAAILAGVLLGFGWRFKTLSGKTSFKSKSFPQEMTDYLIRTERLALIGGVVAGVVHELNNPLTSVIGYSTLLEQTESQEEMRRYAKSIQKESERCRKIVRSLLDFSRRKDASTQHLCSINEIYQEIIDLKGLALSRLQITIVTDFDTADPKVMGDAHELQQVLLSLLSNAEESMGKQPPPKMIRVSTHQNEKLVEVYVSDTGPGIPAAIKDKIFEPFFTTKKAGEGAGLGLSVCRDILKHHGGELSVDNTVKGGALLKFVLPRVEKKSETKQEAPFSVPQSSQPFKDCRVVIVDDEPHVISFYENALIPMGCHVKGFKDVDSAIEYLSKNEFDVMIMDYRMSGRSSKEVFDYVYKYKFDKARKIILSSGDSYDKEMRALIEKVGNIFLPKPCSMKEITQAIQKTLVW